MTYQRTPEDIARHEAQAQERDANAKGYDTWASRLGYAQYLVPSILLGLSAVGFAWSQDFEAERMLDAAISKEALTIGALVAAFSAVATWGIRAQKNFNKGQADWERDYARGLRAGEYW